RSLLVVRRLDLLNGAQLRSHPVHERHVYLGAFQGAEVAANLDLPTVEGARRARNADKLQGLTRQVPCPPLFALAVIRAVARVQGEPDSIRQIRHDSGV